MSTRERLAALVDLGDLDELVRTVDALVDERDWDGMVELRDRCRRALERGRQLWPVASLCEYRLALDAPGPWAAKVLIEGTGHLALGPLAEVAASRHRWAELADHLAGGPLTAVVAHECVVRGEDLRADAGRVPPGVIDLPLVLQPWEPSYLLATYRRDGMEVEGPPASSLLGLTDVGLPERLPVPIDDETSLDALLGCTRTWTASGTGRATAVAVEGDAAAAIRALGIRRARAVELAPADALARLAWAAASSGASGRRRGAAAGRWEAWWVLGAIGGLHGTEPGRADDDEPIDPDELGAIAVELRWFAFDAFEPETGWFLRLAVEDPVDGVAWAISALDQA